MECRMRHYSEASLPPIVAPSIVRQIERFRSFSLLIDDHRNGLGADIDSDEVELFHPLLPGTL